MFKYEYKRESTETRLVAVCPHGGGEILAADWYVGVGVSWAAFLEGFLGEMNTLLEEGEHSVALVWLEKKTTATNKETVMEESRTLLYLLAHEDTEEELDAKNEFFNSIDWSGWVKGKLQNPRV